MRLVELRRKNCSRTHAEATHSVFCSSKTYIVLNKKQTNLSKQRQLSKFDHKLFIEKLLKTMNKKKV